MLFSRANYKHCQSLPHLGQSQHKNGSKQKPLPTPFSHSLCLKRKALQQADQNQEVITTRNQRRNTNFTLILLWLWYLLIKGETDLALQIKNNPPTPKLIVWPLLLQGKVQISPLPVEYRQRCWARLGEPPTRTLEPARKLGVVPWESVQQ